MKRFKKIAIPLLLTIALFFGIPIAVLDGASAATTIDRSKYPYLWSVNDQNITFTEGNSTKTIYVGKAYSYRGAAAGPGYAIGGLDEWVFPGYNYTFSTYSVGGITLSLVRTSIEQDMTVTIDGKTYNRASPLYLKVSTSGTLVPGVYTIKMRVPIVWYYGVTLAEYYEMEYCAAEYLNVTLTVIGTTPTYEVPSNVTGTYGDTLSTVSLPDNFSWTTDGSTILTNAGSSSSFVAKYSPPYYTNSVSGISVPVTVAKRTANLVWSGTETRTYDGNPSNVTAAIGNLVSGDTCAVTVDGGKAIKAGTYTATATITGLSEANYILPTETSIAYTIEPAPVTFTVSDTTAEYDGQPHTATVKQALTDAVQMNTSDYDILYQDAEGNTSETVTAAGTYDIIASITSGNFTTSNVNLGTFTITPRTAELSWSGTAHTYDGIPAAVSAVVSNLVSGDSCSVTISGGAEINTGSYTATAVSLDNANYTLPEGTTAAYTISPRAAILSWSGLTHTYDGTPAVVSAVVSNLVSGDSCSVTISGGAEINAGSYAATAISLDNANYTLPADPTAAYTISPRVAALSWSGTETRSYDGSAAAVSAVVSNLISGDSCSVTISGGTEINAGSHTATVVSLDNANYTLPADPTAAYTISPRVAVLSWVGTNTRSYDGSAAAVSAVVSNLLSVDSCSVTISGGAEINAGSHTATAVSLDNSNYTLPEDPTAAYTINPAAVTFVLSNAVAYFDGQQHTATVTQAADDAVQMAAGDYSVIYRNSAGDTSGSASAVGTYEIIVSIDNGNFICAVTSLGSFTIEYLTVSPGMYIVPENFGADAWYNSDLVISAGDGYVISLSPASGYGDTVSISDEAVATGTTATVYVTSTAGGTVYVGAITYKLDKTVPVISAVNGNPSDWKNTDAVLTVDASDALSGIAAYSFDGGVSWQTENTHTYADNTIIPANTIQTKDAAGNIAAFVNEIVIEKIDKTAPVIVWDSNTAAAADGKWFASVVINGSATDDQSGVLLQTLQISKNGGMSVPESIGYEINTVGTYIVTLTTVDKVGNSSSETLTFRVDPVIGELQSYVSALNGTTSTFEDVLTVINWYDELTESQKDHIQKSVSGTADCNTLQEYWNAAQNRAVEEIKGIITAGGPALSDITTAEDLYAKLDTEHKSMIDADAWTNLGNKKDALKVEDLISLIPDHALSADCTDLAYHKATIENAVLSFEALSGSARAYVSTEKVTYLRQQYALLLAMLGYNNKAGVIEIIGLVERVNVSADAVISVQVEQLNDQVVENQSLAYNITLVATAADGTTTEIQPVDGKTVTVKIKLDSDVIPNSVSIYHILDDGTQEVIGAENNLHFVTENGSIYVIFDVSHFSVYAMTAEKYPATTGSTGSGGSAVVSASLPTYIITATANAGGSITPSSVKITRWDSTTLEIEAAEGYHIEDVLLDGGSVLNDVILKENGSATYTIEKIITAHTVTAVFALDTGAEVNFNDISKHWAYDNIVTVIRKGLMTGVSQTEFDPDGSVTRAMVVTVLWRLEGEPAATSSSNFTDVAENAWYNEAVAWAAENGVILGYGNGLFAPEGQISRQELALVLYRYLSKGGAEKSGTALNYSDTGSISPWALDGVSWCTVNGILTGRNDGSFDPGATTTRAELAVILSRLLANK